MDATPDTRSRLYQVSEFPFQQIFRKNRNFLDKIPLFCIANSTEMKKIAIALLIALVSSIVLSSCRSTSSCPAYGETNKYQIETSY